MRSLLTVCDLIPRKFGAYERFLVELGRACTARGIRMGLILAGDPIGPVAAALGEQGVRWRTIEGWKDESDRERPGRLAREIGAIRPSDGWDAVAFHFCGEASVVRALLAARLSGGWRPLSVWHQHSEIRPAGWIRRHICRMRVLARFLDGFVANSRVGARELVNRGCPEARVAMIHNAVPIPPGPRRGDLRAELGLPGDSTLIASVGSLIPRKGMDVLIEAAAPLLLGDARRYLLIVGEGPLRSDLIGQVESLGLAGRVLFLGSRDDVPEVLADCDLFALATRSETFTLAVIEAMAARLPVVTTDVGGHSELLDDGATGILVPPDDPRSFRAALASLLGRPDEAAELGRRARARAEAHFGLDRTVADLLDFYLRLRSGNAPAGVGDGSRAACGDRKELAPTRGGVAPRR